MIIKKIVKQKNGKYKIFFNDGETLITYDEVILNNSLLQNKEIKYDLFHKIKEDNSYYDVYYKVIKYLSVKMRSLKEINNYLLKFELSIKEQKQIIARLEQMGLINDYNFAKSYLNDQLNLTSAGPLSIKKELLKHNIDEKVIDDLINGIPEEELIAKVERLITKRIKTNHKYSNYMLKQKITKDLLNLGFDYELINNKIGELLIADTGILEKEFNKVYKKYQAKLTQPQLDYKIRQALYQKGFNLEDINQLLVNKKCP